MIVVAMAFADDDTINAGIYEFDNDESCTHGNNLDNIGTQTIM